MFFSFNKNKFRSVFGRMELEGGCNVLIFLKYVIVHSARTNTVKLEYLNVGDDLYKFLGFVLFNQHYLILSN